MSSPAEQAAAWIVRLTGDDSADRALARAEYERWQQADPRHAELAAEMERLLGQLQGLRQENRPARAAIAAALPRRRPRRRTTAFVPVLVLALLLPLAALIHRSLPVDVWLADLRNAPGEWSTHTLADGSTLTLGSGSAVELSFDERGRLIELHRGALLIDVAPDSTRPLLVKTPHGVIRALGTRFAVTRGEASTRLEMLESRTAVRSAGGETLELDAGQQVVIYRDRLEAPTPMDTDSVVAAWRDHRLVVRDQPLAAVLEQLDRHQRGLLLFDRAALADIRVTAVLPLDDTDRALQLLARNFPTLRIQRLNRWLVRIDQPAIE